MFENISFYIKNLGLIMFSLLYYYKIINKKYDNKNILILMGYSMICTGFTCIIDERLPQLSVPFIVIIILIYTCMFIDNFKYKYLKIFVSYALSYISLAVAAVISTVIMICFPEKILMSFNQLISFILQTIIFLSVVNCRRIKGGILFLDKVIYFIPCVILGIFIMMYSIIVNSNGYGVRFIVIFIGLLLLAILLFIYWRTSITRHYLERLSLRNIDSLNNELDEKNALIKRLIEDKDRIEKLNHKNYKLVPAMQGAVMHYLTGVKEYMDIVAQTPAFNEMTATGEGALTGDKLNGFIDEGNRLIEELKKMSSEWTEFVNNENLTGDKEISSCGIPRVDYILSYMHDRSLKEGFLLKIDIEQSVDKLTEKIISEEDVATLVADLIENAIIATRHNNREDILVRLGVMKKEFILEVYDSGTPFDKDVLAKYGKEKITTHADDNGSGIGMMQTYEILGKCGASLYIDELSEESGLYTKRISIVFNKKNQYVLYTKRSDDEIAYLHKRSDMMIIRK